jgi:hypothetical protein
MEITILITFGFVTLLALFEGNLHKYRRIIYIALTLFLILLAGLREVGMDPDSINYEQCYLHYDDINALQMVEYSYVLLSEFFNHFTHDVHILFLFYAIIGVGVKMYAFTKLSRRWFLPVMVYLSYYYTMHDCMQIRTGILSAMLLMAIYEMGQQRRWRALAYIVIGSVFHMSGLIALPLVFLSNNKINKKHNFAWIALVALGYIIFLSGFSFTVGGVDLPYISAKIETYQAATESGKGDTFSSVNVFSPLRLFIFLLFLYLSFFRQTITLHCPCFPILFKVFALGIFSYAAFAFFPVVAQRFAMLFEIVTTILYAGIFYTIKPRWASLTILSLVCLLLMNYSLCNLGFILFWKV